MARNLKGTTHWVATSLAAAKTVTGVTNATSAVCTSAAHGYAVGDVVVLYSGWSRLYKRAFRISAQETNTFTLETADTTNTTLFPAGTGTGTVAKVTGWTQVPKVLESNPTGGEAKSTDYEFMEDENTYTLNNGFNAVKRSIAIDADTMGTAGYTLLRSLTDVQTDTVLKVQAKTGAFTLLPCTVAMNEEETIVGNIAAVRIDVNGSNRSTRYAS